MIHGEQKQILRNNVARVIWCGERYTRWQIQLYWRFDIFFLIFRILSRPNRDKLNIRKNALPIHLDLSLCRGTGNILFKFKQPRDYDDLMKLLWNIRCGPCCGCRRCQWRPWPRRRSTAGVRGRCMRAETSMTSSKMTIRMWRYCWGKAQQVGSQFHRLPALSTVRGIHSLALVGVTAHLEPYQERRIMWRQSSWTVNR